MFIVPTDCMKITGVDVDFTTASKIHDDYYTMTYTLNYWKPPRTNYKTKLRRSIGLKRGYKR